jgi:hypothetical protein
VELVECKENRMVRGPDRVEQVPGDDHRVRPGLDDLVHGPPECIGDVRLPLIEPAGCLAVILAESEMQVGKMSDLHRRYSKAGGVARKWRRPDATRLPCDYIDINAFSASWPLDSVPDRRPPA